eukprot:13414772-Heterocapsa_arctica.AAC.1
MGHHPVHKEPEGRIIQLHDQFMIKAAPQGGVADHKRKREEDEAAKARSQLGQWKPPGGKGPKGQQWSGSGKAPQQ